MLKVRCQADAKLDEKGRLALPAALKHAMREEGVTGLVLAYHKGALWGWTPEDFAERIEGPIAARDPFADDVIDMVHALISTAQDVKVDPLGRVLIPQKLRELADLSRDIVVHSVVDRVEIWDAPRWNDRFREALDRRAVASGMPKGSAS